MTREHIVVVDAALPPLVNQLPLGYLGFREGAGLLHGAVVTGLRAGTALGDIGVFDVPGRVRLDFWHRWRDAGNSVYIANRVVIGHAELMIKLFATFIWVAVPGADRRQSPTWHHAGEMRAMSDKLSAEERTDMTEEESARFQALEKEGKSVQETSPSSLARVARILMEHRW